MKKMIIRLCIGSGILAGIVLAVIMFAYIPFFKVTEGEPVPESSVLKPALMVVDVQEGLSGSLSNRLYKGYVNQSEGLVLAVNAMIEAAVAREIPVIYVYHEDTHPVIRFITGSHMARGSAATAIDKRVKIVSENIFSKSIMDGFSNPELYEYLVKNGINSLYLTGLDAAFCVYRTSLAAKNRNVDVTLVTDAVISSTPEKKEKMIKKYTSNGIKTATVSGLKKKKDW